uniref:Uncharacterized protein n=1 Tax=Meloidogyne javanica TaxID=6303 RepID=A0A915M1M1_MELJA
MLSRQMFTPINSLPTPIVPTKVPNVGTSNGNLIKQTKNGWKVSNLNFGINQDDSICLSIKLEKSAKINEIDKQKVKATLDSIKFIENLIVDNSLNKDEKKNSVLLKQPETKININNLNKQQNMLKTVKDVEQNNLKVTDIKPQDNQFKELVDNFEKFNESFNSKETQEKIFLQFQKIETNFMEKLLKHKDVGFVEFFRFKNPYEHVKLEQYALSKGICNSIEKVNNWQLEQPQEVENYENLNIPKNGWIVDNLSFTNGNNNSKAALDAIKYIEKLLVDCSSNKGEDNNEELLEEKIKELNLNDKNISLQILKMHNDHVDEVKELKNEIKQKMEENNFLMKKVEELLENSYLDNSKNKKLRDEKGGICVEIDNS